MAVWSIATALLCAVLSNTRASGIDTLSREPSRRATPAVHVPSMAGPVLLATAVEIGTARANCAKTIDPWKSACAKTSTRANAALSMNLDYVPGAPESSFYDEGTKASGFARDLAFAFQMTGNPSFAAKARAILINWAQQQTPYSNANIVDGGLHLSRVAASFCYAYSLIYGELSNADRTTLNATYGRWADFIKSSLRYWADHNYMWGQYYQNHLGAMDLGLLAIGRMIGNEALVEYAIDSAANPRNAKEMIQGAIYMAGDTLDARDPGTPPVWDGEIYDRYRAVQYKGLGYSLFHLQLLMKVATIAKHRGTNLFSYTAPTGENLGLALDYHAEFLRTRDPSVNGGFYASEPFGQYWSDTYLSMYETGRAEYPNNHKITDALLGGGIRGHEFDPTYGYTEVLLRGR
jgi:hypothetical protein